jgi:hypothetical protein
MLLLLFENVIHFKKGTSLSVQVFIPELFLKKYLKKKKKEKKRASYLILFQ